MADDEKFYLHEQHHFDSGVDVGWQLARTNLLPAPFNYAVDTAAWDADPDDRPLSDFATAVENPAHTEKVEGLAKVLYETLVYGEQPGDMCEWPPSSKEDRAAWTNRAKAAIEYLRGEE